VIATSNYSDPALPSLGAAARDAIEMAEVLADQRIGAFEVTRVLDRTAHEIRLAVQDFLDGRGREDLVVVYLSCHGLLDKHDRLYFAGTDTREDHLPSTGVEAAWLGDRLDESRAARQVVILDCCYSGAFGRLGGKSAAGTDVGLKQFVTQGRGRASLMASRPNQRAWVEDAAGGVASPSVFTSALVEGLRTGHADVDGDGYISVDEAYKYAYDKVVADGAGQIPQKSISGGEGTLLLARNQAGLTVIPAPLPESLRILLDSPYPPIRMDAVNILGEWLTGPDPAKTLTAQQTLSHIAVNEVPDIATAAREQLDRWVRAHEEAIENAIAEAQMNSDIELTRDQILSIVNTLNANKQAMFREMGLAKQQMSDNLYRAYLEILGANPPDPPA
jgi:hypothetical protein